MTVTVYGTPGRQYQVRLGTIYTASSVGALVVANPNEAAELIEQGCS
jgi:hypothetical protein